MIAEVDQLLFTLYIAGYYWIEREHCEQYIAMKYGWA